MARSRARVATPKTAAVDLASVASVAPAALTAAAVRRVLRAQVEAGAVLHVAGCGKHESHTLMRGRYAPTSLIELFGTRFFLTDYFQTPELRFFVAYLTQASQPRRIYARIIYKDGSLVWRCASHMVSSADEFWIGKGDVRTYVADGEERIESVESTTDMPFEMQSALETVSRQTLKIRKERRALDLVLRNSPADRVQAYADFTAPRRRAAARVRDRINGGRSITRFRDKRDPSSLEIVPGYEPDYERGIVEDATSTSVLYGGVLRRVRIVSVNRLIQYLFFAGPLQVWIIPPQATTSELSTFGVRPIDVIVDDDMCCPGYEYHYLEDELDPPVLYSQIPPGFAGAAGPHDPDRADASPWLDKMPIIRDFRRRVLGSSSSRSRRR